MKTKIKLTTSGLPVGERTSSRGLDLDHAQTITEFTKRGYIVTAKSETTPMWSVSFYDGEAGRLFSNTPEWVSDDTRNVFVRTHKGADDGRLYDDEPVWIEELRGLCRTAAGNTINWH